MKKQFTLRLISLLLTATLLFSATGLMAVVASAEEPKGGSNSALPSVTATPAVNAVPTVAAEGGSLNRSGVSINAEGEALTGAKPMALTWLGVDGTTNNMGKPGNPYAVPDLEHFLGIHDIVNDSSSADKYFRLTADIDLESLTISDFRDYAGFKASLITVNPALAVSDPDKVFFNLDGKHNGVNNKIKNLDVIQTNKTSCGIFGYIGPNSVLQNITFENCTLTANYQLARVNAVVAVQNAGIIRGCQFNGMTLTMATGGDSWQDNNDSFSFAGHHVYLGNSAVVGDNRGTIENCSLNNINISVTKRWYVGAVAGQNSGTIGGTQTVTVNNVNITAATGSVSMYFGGITGKNHASGSISNSTVTLSGTGPKFTRGSLVGGIAGMSAGVINNCAIVGTVTNIGNISDINCDFIGGNAIADANAVFGGIVGRNTGTVSYSTVSNVGMLFTATLNAVYGGIAGQNTGRVQNSWASGKQDHNNVSGTRIGYSVGGIVGFAEEGTLVEGSYALVALSDKATAAGAVIGGSRAKLSMLSSTNPNRWSSAVSSLPTHCALNGSDDYDISKGVKALNIKPSLVTTVSKTLFTHSWGTGGPAMGLPTAFSSPGTHLSLDATGDNVVLTAGAGSGVSQIIFYYVTFTLPQTGPSRVGADAVSRSFNQRLFIHAAITTGAGADPVVSRINPIGINSQPSLAILYSVPYADFRLDFDMTQPLTWIETNFTGTLDGNGRTLSVNRNLFKGVYGSRGDTPPENGGPDIEANLAKGYIYSLNIVVTGEITTGVLGSVYGGTVKTVKLTGDASAYLRIYGGLSSNTGGLINTLRGNAYVYGCFTNLPVNITTADANNIGGLIGHLNAEKARIENCGSNADISSDATLPNVGSLIGGISANEGKLLNCFAAGKVQRGGHIAIGNKLANHLVENLYWSLKDTNPANQATVLPVNNISESDSVIEWKFDEGDFGFVPTDGGVNSIHLTVPPSVTMFENPVVGDFTDSVDPNKVTVMSRSIENNTTLLFSIKMTTGATLPIETGFEAVHTSTGLRARITINNGISVDGNGYFMVYTPAELQYLSDEQSRLLTNGANFKIRLYADIDMNGYNNYKPIGNATYKFGGIFDGNGKTVSNLSVESVDQGVGLFGFVAGAKIGDFTLKDCSFNVTGALGGAGCIAGVAHAGAGTVDTIIGKVTAGGMGIKIVDCQVVGTTRLGGVVGNSVATTGRTLSLSDIEIDNLSVSASGNTAAAGGVLGNAALNTGINISNVTINNISLEGKNQIGGVVGSCANSTSITQPTLSITNAHVTGISVQGEQSLGGVLGFHNGIYKAVGITNVSVKKGEGAGSISGTGYVGGIVGQGRLINVKGAEVNGLHIFNSGTTATGNGATGGIAGMIKGTVGDAGTQGCLVTDTLVEGMVAGGIIGKGDNGSVTYGTNNLTVKNCTVAGNTVIKVPDLDLSYTSIANFDGIAAGIVGDYSTAYQLIIEDCIVKSGILVENGKRTGGIIGWIASSNIAAKTTITNCQSFAEITSFRPAVNAGGIAGVVNNRAENFQLSNSVAGGSITLTGSSAEGVAGLVGNHTNSPTLLVTSYTQPYATNCYITTVITTTLITPNKGKILGTQAASMFVAFSDTTIDTAFSGIVFSSYPQDIIVYGNAGSHLTYPYLQATNMTYLDINKPDSVNNPDHYQHGSDQAFQINGNIQVQINVDNLPPSAYDVSPAGWVSFNDSALIVDYFDRANQLVYLTAWRNFTTGIKAEYVNGSVLLYGGLIPVALSFEAFIPIQISGVDYDWGGDGSDSNPFLIRTKDDLVAMKENILTDYSNNEYFGGFYLLANDLVFTPEDFRFDGAYYNGSKGFDPMIGTSSANTPLPFCGGFDGGGHTISGLKQVIIAGSGADAGLFAQTATHYDTVLDLYHYPSIHDLNLSDFVIAGDTQETDYAGFVVGRAGADTEFFNINVENSSLERTLLYSGGIVGQAADSNLQNCRVSGCLIKTNQESGYAGGIAGTFSGTIGDPAYMGSGYDVTVDSCEIVGGARAGGILGYNLNKSVMITSSLVTGTTEVDASGEESAGAGGIAGAFEGTGGNSIIEKSVVDEAVTVTSKNISGGIVGRSGLDGTAFLTIEKCRSFADVSATNVYSEVLNSSASAFIGHILNGRRVKLHDSIVGGSAQANKYTGGIIAFIEGNTHQLNSGTTDSLIKNIVVAADVTAGPQAKKGLLLGGADPVLLPANVIYTHLPFINVKFSSYQFGEGYTGVGAINTIQSPNLFASVYDLNLPEEDWTADYRGLRNALEFSDNMIVVLGEYPEVFNAAGSNNKIQTPKIIGDYGIRDGGEFDLFEDKQGVEFKLKAVYSETPGLVTYDVPSRTLIKTAEDASDNLIFEYENGLKVALNLLAYAELLGNGSEDHPYHISTINHLMLVRLLPSRYFYQSADLEFQPEDFEPGGAFYNEGALWEPIKGLASNVYFTGNYDGNGFSISGVKTNRPAAEFVGFFAKIQDGGRVYDLTLNNTEFTGGKYVGTLAGYVSGNGSEAVVENIEVNSGKVTSTYAASFNNHSYAGGLVGFERSSVDTPAVAGLLNCTVKNTSVSALGTNLYSTAAGIAAAAQKIHNCNAGGVDVSSGLYAAGIVATASIAGATATSPVEVKNSSLIDGHGATVVKTTANTTTAVVGGIFAMVDKPVQLILENNDLGNDVALNATRGCAGGVLGKIALRNDLAWQTNDLSVLIKACESYAYINSKLEGGAIVGAIKGFYVDLREVRIEGCVAAGGVSSLNTAEGTDIGGIIGCVAGSGGFTAPDSTLIIDCISSASVETKSANKGKIIGNAASLTSVPEGSYSAIFENIHISSYPQNINLIGNSTMNAYLKNSGGVKDLFWCNGFGAFTVDIVADGTPMGEYREIAIAPYFKDNPIPTVFNARILVDNGTDTPDDLTQGPVSIDPYHQISFHSFYSTTSAYVDQHPTISHRFTIDPLSSTSSGYIVSDLDYGLEIGIPQISFEITGKGTVDDPFKIYTVEQLTLMYYLPEMCYLQMNDLHIQQSDYSAKNPAIEDDEDGILYYRDTAFEGKGFRPIAYDTDPSTAGHQGAKFSGTFDGQGYRITGVKATLHSMDYIGFFGYAAAGAQFRDIHIELVEHTNIRDGGINGRKYVGGLIAYCESGVVIDNCSVVGSSVAGQHYVGGLVGALQSSINGSFTTCEVVAYGIVDSSYAGEAGGIAGRLNNSAGDLSLTKCFATGSIYSGFAGAGGLVGAIMGGKNLNVENAFFTGDIRTGLVNQYMPSGAQAILIGHTTAATGTRVYASKIYVAGTNTSFRSTMFPVAYSASVGTVTSAYYDSSILGLSTAQGTAATTETLTNGTLPTGFAEGEWTVQSGSYPSLKMTMSGSAAPDTYAGNHSALAALPLFVNEKDTTPANGLKYSPYLPSALNGGALTLRSSKFDITDLSPYPAGYDPDLYGNDKTGVNDRAVDLLFRDDGDNVVLYRNIFGRKTYPEYSNQVGTTSFKDGKLVCGHRAPAVTISINIGGLNYVRNVRIPLEYENYHYYIATERQLRAMTNENNAEAPNTKFCEFYSGINTDSIKSAARYQLIADINLRNVAFEPIMSENLSDNGFYGKFNGNEFTISNVNVQKDINLDDNIGLFRVLTGETGGSAGIYNLNLENVNARGRKNVGALVGYANGYSAIENCRVTGGGAVEGSRSVGGLVGASSGSIINSSTVNTVTGKDVVGGLVGLLGEELQATVADCYSTGAVLAEITDNYEINNFGAGGLAGVIQSAKVRASFASGSVKVTSVDNFGYSTTARVIGIGGFAGVYMAGEFLEACFASGVVEAENIGEMKNSGGRTIYFGAGGFVGVNLDDINSCYASSSVDAKFTGDVQGSASGNVAAGVGGITGVSIGALQDCYSSGSVKRTTLPGLTELPNTYFASAFGGAIGTTLGATVGFSNLYFDYWTNGYGADFLPIGDLTVMPTGSVKALKTTEFWSTDTSVIALSNEFWSINSGAYPCLKLLAGNTNPRILYPTIVSVVAVTPNERDTSAFAGNGITMPLTMPPEIVVDAVEYDLTWEASEDSEVEFMVSLAADGISSVFVPVRTLNTYQNLSLNVWVTDNAQYATRRFDRLCAEMLGTEAKPYLIATKEDLRHIGLTAQGYADAADYGFANFYDTWYSPVTIDESGACHNYEDKVYFKLLSDIDMTRDVIYTFDPVTKELLDVEVKAPNWDSDTSNDNHYIGDITSETYPGSITFKGIDFAGNDFRINNFTSTKEFLYGVSNLSEIKDVVFVNLNIDSRGTANENTGTALARNNAGVVDGCMILSGSVAGGNNVASVIAFNSGTVKNTSVKVNVTGNTLVGGIVAVNNEGASVETSAYGGGTVSTAAASQTNAFAGALTGSNSGHIIDCFTMGNVTSSNGANALGGITGTNVGTGLIENAFSRTSVSGYDNIGGFAGLNAGTIKNAFSAGQVTVDANAVQTGVFCGTNTGTVTDAFADKSISGSSTYARLEDTTPTGCIMSMTYFSAAAQAVYVKSLSETAYPQLKAITELDSGYGEDEYIPQKFQLLIGCSAIASATIDTKYSQYVDTLALSTANPVSAITAPRDYLTAVSWTTTDASVITTAGTTGATAGTATLTAKITVNASNGNVLNLALPIEVRTGAQNPNFTGGDGSVSNPYQINSVASFNSLAYYGPNGEISYKLTADINYEGSGPAVPITNFDGKLDGDGHVIYDLTVGNNSGLFGSLNTGSEVKNLGLVGAEVTAPSTEGYIGLLAGRAYNADIVNCYVIGEIEAEATSMGGLVGLASNGTLIDSCLTSGRFVNTSQNADALTGGIAGSADTQVTVSNSLSTAYVVGDGIVGGIVGEATGESAVNNSVFAGTVLDSALESGALVPAIQTIGNIAGTVSGDSNITGCAYDRQLTFIADSNAIAKNTDELLTGSVYTLPAGLSGGSGKFAAGLAFAASPVRFYLGDSAGSVTSFSKITFPGTISGDSVTATEKPQNLEYHLNIQPGNPIQIDLMQNLDLADVYAGLEFELDTTAGTVFSSMNNGVVRYARPCLNRIVEVDYTLTNSSGDSAMDSEIVSILLKNKHNFAGEPVTYVSGVFTAAASTVSTLEDLVVSSGGFFAAGMLPAGYNYTITAQDQNGDYLLGSAGNGVGLRNFGDEYGCYIPLNDDTTAVTIHFFIVTNEPWGVYRFWTSLV